MFITYKDVRRSGVKSSQEIYLSKSIVSLLMAETSLVEVEQKVGKVKSN